MAAFDEAESQEPDARDLHGRGAGSPVAKSQEPEAQDLHGRDAGSPVAKSQVAETPAVESPFLGRQPVDAPEPEEFATLAAVLDTTQPMDDRSLAMVKLSPDDWRAPAAAILEGLEALVDAVRVTDRVDARMHLRRRLLMWLADGKPRYLTEVMIRERASASAVQRVATQLEAEGLLTKFRVASDARYVRVRATEPGLARARAIRRARCGLLARRLRYLSPSEMEAMVTATRAAARVADEMLNPRRTY